MVVSKDSSVVRGAWCVVCLRFFLFFYLLWQRVLSASCRGRKEVHNFIPADRMRHLVRIEERYTQLISQGVVGSAASRCDLTRESLRSRERVEEGGGDEDGGGGCVW